MVAKAKTVRTEGFLPDFSRYLFDEYPIREAHRYSALIDKLKRLVAELITTVSPAQDLQNGGLCQKLEKITPKDSKEWKFIQKCAFDEGQIYYATFGRNPYRIVFGIDSNGRIAYLFALDTRHSVRKG